MSQATCPSCATRFENNRAFIEGGLRKRLYFGPERLLAIAKRDAAADDECPSCGRRSASREFLVVSEFVRARIHSMGTVYLLVLLMIGAVVLSARLGS